MNYIRKHWFDIGGIAGLIILVVLLFEYQKLSNYQLLMWLSLISLFSHQLEEYRIAGTFPGMVNRVLFNSDLPDRYPLNSNTSLIINVFFRLVHLFICHIGWRQINMAWYVNNFGFTWQYCSTYFCL